MKTLRKVASLGTLALIALASASASFAGVSPRYSGEFKFEPKAGHATALTGALVLTSTDGQQFSAAVFTPTAPVYGKRELPTEGLVNHFFQAGSAEKLALIFKMKGATHRWQFVALMQTKDGGVTYELSFYKVNATPEEIRAEMTRLGVAGLPAPAWKAAGTALVKN